MPKIVVPFGRNKTLYCKGFRDGANHVNMYGQHLNPDYAAGHGAGVEYRKLEDSAELNSFEPCSNCVKLEAELKELKKRHGCWYPTASPADWQELKNLNKTLDQLDDLIDECKNLDDPPVELLENPAWR